MKKINVVYAHMREPRFDIVLPGKNAHVVWTAMEEPDADVVVYHNGYSYKSKIAAKNPSAFRILYTYEPLVVYPRQFLSGFWKPFDAVLTWNETLLEQGGKFVRCPSVCYDFPFGSVHGVAGTPVCPADWRTKRNAICQVAGNKYSLIPSELYSRRRKIARWFGRHGSLPLDTYGVPPMSVPNYRGRTDDKQKTLSGYRFALCLENDSHPLWSRGYITEKIFDCFYAFTVPIYLGADDVEKTIPTDCFIDLRKFASLPDLERHLLSISDEEFRNYLSAIERFLKDYDAPQKHSCFQLYEKALQLAVSARDSLPESELTGFWQTASWMEKVHYVLMVAALPVYKKIRGTRYAGTK